METSDHELLRLFVKNRSEDAFRRMVDRHLNLVFATARRIVGDPQLAEEVAQGVFVLLTRKAGEIKSAQPLAGWLYHTTRHQALNVSRAEGRRRQREQTAAAMQPNETNPAPERITAELEEAMDELLPDDRDTLLLRFLDNRQLRDVGTELGVSEEAARKRVNRALEKLRGIFGKRGVALSTGLLATTLAGQAGTVVPAALGTAITATALSQLAGLSATTIATVHTTTTMSTLFNLKTAAVVLGIAAVTGTSTYLVKEREADRLRADYQSLNEAQAKMAKDQREAASAIKLRDDQIASLKKDIAGLPRLRGEIDSLRRQLAELAALKDENEKPKDSPAIETGQSRQEEEASKVFDPEEWAQMPPRKLPPLRSLGMNMMVYAKDHKGWFPTVPELQTMLKAEAASATPIPEATTTPEDMIVLFHGNLEDIPVRERNGTIVARQSDYTAGPGGSYARAYLFADGSAQIHAEDTMEKLTAWENERIIPANLQSQRP